MVLGAEPTQVWLLSKDDENCRRAGAIAKAFFGDRLRWIPNPTVDDLAPVATAGSWLLSYRCPLVVPTRVLDSFDISLNWHPGSSEFPGIGCYNFAIDQRAEEYGIVCHHMAQKVDSGPIVEEVLFPMPHMATVPQLQSLTLHHLVESFDRICRRLVEGSPLPNPAIKWKRSPFTRRDLDSLCRLSPDMSSEELERRLRATLMNGHPTPFVELHGFLFRYEEREVPRS